MLLPVGLSETLPRLGLASSAVLQLRLRQRQRQLLQLLPTDPAQAPTDCQAAAGEHVLSQSEVSQGLVDGVAALRAQRANLEGALARPGAIQQQQMAAPRIVARALAVQVADAMLQTIQKVQASTRAACSAHCQSSCRQHRRHRLSRLPRSQHQRPAALSYGAVRAGCHAAARLGSAAAVGVSPACGGGGFSYPPPEEDTGVAGTACGCGD